MTDLSSSPAGGHGPRAGQPPLAIVGIGCRFPGGADDAESFWAMLAAGRCGIREVPPDRWDVGRYYNPDPAVPGTLVTKWGGFVDNLAGFDAAFWGISPREAMRMDPQQRWLLEVAWEALEDAGTPPGRLRGADVGVFVGIATNDYGGLQLANVRDADFYTMSGSTLSIASNRISYLLDLRGPSVSVDTACSSALVAVWAACRSIWAGDCAAALAGGANTLITPNASIGFSKASMLSPSGRCYAFDARANGYVRGEGAGAVYIKPLERALADGDRVYAVIRAAVSNQDGHTSSMTVPGVEGQSAMLRDAYAEAGVDPARVAYVEAHGTGTPVGDPIEAAALGRVLGAGRPAGRPCLIGSVKTNVGHLEAGSGMPGLIKAALALHHGQVPPSINYEQPNPNIPFAALGLRVASALQPLPNGDVRRPIVGVNSFGFGGTNAHVVLEQAPEPGPRPAPGPGDRAVRPHLLPISARDDAALRRYVEAYRALLAVPGADLADVCRCAGERKEHHDRRLAVIGESAAQLRRRLGAWLRGASAAEGVVAGSAAGGSSVVFVFTGQGAQWWGMGRQLLEREPVYRRAVTAIDDLLRPLAGWSLLEELTRGEADSNIDRTEYAQPAIFALQVGLAELWKSWGVRPSKVVGHSVGEVAAAYVAGAYALDDAVRVIYHRSRLQGAAGGDGRMLAAGISAAEARRAIGAHAGRVHIAVFGGPQLVTLAGDRAPLEEIAARLEGDGKFVRWLRINYAFHTHHMDPIRDELLRALAGTRPRPTAVPFISTVTGGMIPPDRLDAGYWWRNVRQPVLFAPAITALARGNEDTFLEIGPHPALAGAVGDCLKEQGRKAAVFHSLRRQAGESQELLTNLAGLHVHGAPVDWAGVSQGGGSLVRLPRYPWARETFWLESDESRRTRLEPAEHPLLGLRVSAALPTWQFDLHPGRVPYLNDHRVWDSVVFPAAGYVEMGLAVARSLFPDEPHAVEDLEIAKALFVADDRPPAVQVVFDPATKEFSVHSGTGDRREWELNARGRLTPAAAVSPEPVDLARLREPLAEHFDHERFYADALAAGYQFGPNFKEVRNVWRVHGEALAEIGAPDAVAAELGRYQFHPALLDACFHVFRGLKVAEGDPRDNFYLPQSICRVRLFRARPAARLWAHGRLLLDDGKSLVADVRVYDEHGARVADVLGFRLDRVEQPRAAADVDNCYYQFRWEPRRLRGSRVDGPCGFPATSDLAAAARAAAGAVGEEFALRQYFDVVPRMEELVVRSVQRAWLQLGWRPRVGERFAAAELIERLGIVDEFHRLARSQLRALARHGLLRPAGGDEWEVIRQLRPGDVDAEMEALAREHPIFAAEVRLHRRTGPGLAAALAGEAEPMELLFPGGSFELVERIYTEAGENPAMTRLMRDVVARLVAGLPPRRVLRVLEVGAGTGSLTRVVLPVLPADRTEYHFTDVSPAFLAAARKQFAAFPFVQYALFDAEKAPPAQGLEPGGFDLVLASQVLHATADLKKALANLRAGLATDGLLMFHELVPRRHALEHTFGLLRGWWRFTDTDLRPDGPLLEREQWHALLSEMGFRDVGSFTPAADERRSEHGCFLALAPAAPPPAEAAVPVDRGCYLVFADEGGVGRAVCERLDRAGYRTVRVRAGREFRQVDEADFVIDPSAEEDYRRVLAAPALAGEKPAGVVHCWALDHAGDEGLTPERLLAAQRAGVLSLLHLLHALGEAMPPGIWCVARGMHHVHDGDRVEGLAAAPLVGFARVANNEYAPNRVNLIDLAAEPDPAEADDLVQEVTAGDGETEAAYRGGRRHVLRLGRVRADELPRRATSAARAGGEVTPFRLQMSRPGILTNLAWHETRRREPAAGEVEVRVRAAGINFRDVLKALGTYPGNPVDLLWFGDDVAGVVERVGPDVRHLRPGDAVAGMAPYGFRSHALTDARLLFPKPPAMSFEEAATLPTVFLTVHYALNHLARMRPGESILIHAGAGGVGQAAIQIARRLGLTIFATAGSPEKRQLLLDMGVHHVMNSRTLEFADEVMSITGGRGVDAVLNSLAGDFVPKSLSVLAPFGRFLEIGKVDIYRNAKIGLQSFRDNISYFVIDLAQHLLHRPELVAELFEELGRHFAAGDYAPLPRTVFRAARVIDAFRHMAQGKHVGKNVLSFDPPEVAVGPCTEEGHRLRGDATYLVTGGAGGFGLEVAKWMARQGARYLVLFSRSGPRDADSLKAIADMQTSGVTVVDARGDVTRAEDVQRVVAQIRDTMPPLRGVLHGAMVLDDDALAVLDETRFNAAQGPKMLGAWNLHAATLEAPLEHFVCFSSISSVIGVPKQAAYNAGNCFLDALAHYRRARSLPALTINWGALLGAGFVERNRKTADFLGKVGVAAFDVAEALRVLAHATAYDPGLVAAARVEWRATARAFALVGHSPTYAALAREGGEAERGGSLLARLRATGPDARAAVLEDYLAAQVAGVFGTSEDKVDRDAPLTSLGLDSLMAVDLTTRIEREIGTGVPMGSMLSGPSIKVLAKTVLGLVAPSLGAEGAGADDVAAAAGSALPPLERLVPQRDEFPLSEGQQALWFLHRLDPDSPAYNLTFSGRFRPLTDVAAMRRAFAALFERHPMLDVTFAEVDGRPVQRLRRGGTIDFREHDVRGLPDERVGELLVEHANQPFNLERGPVVRLELFRTGDDAHLALLCLHHIVADAWSVALLLNDLVETHFALARGRRPRELPQPFTYQDVVAWEQKLLAGPAGRRLAEYWARELKGAPQQLDLPADRPRAPGRAVRGATHGFRLGEDLSQAVVTLAAEQNVTLFAALLAAFQVLLHRYCRQDDLLVGCPLAGRPQRELTPVVGYFVNMLPLRSRADDDPTFADFLRRTARAAAGAIDHQQYPFARLVRDLKVPRDPGRPPLVQVAFSMERVPGADEQGVALCLIGQGGHKFYVGDLSVETVDVTLRQAQFEITLVVEEAGGVVYGCWQYDRGLFEPATIARLNDLFARILAEVTRDPLRRVSEIDLLAPEERDLVLGRWAVSADAAPELPFVHEWVARRARRHPDKVAVRCGSETLTYAGLEARADALAAQLRLRGVGPDMLVGVLVSRSPDMVVALLGVLKAGGCYVPLDPGYPALRLRQMLEDAGPPIVLTDQPPAVCSQCGVRSVEYGVGNLWIAEFSECGSNDSAPRTPHSAPEDLAYVIYTSGSTGTPKGVEVPHRAIINLLISMAARPGLSADDRLLAVTTLSFDIAALELFLPLGVGGEVCLATREEARDPALLARLLDGYGATVMQATPTTWQMLLDSGWSGRPGLRALCGGEALRPELAARLRPLVGELWNMYGPTETTVWSTCARVDSDAVFIGQPVAGTTVYVLDGARRPVPPGLVGELYIGGLGLARGYRGRPDLTGERFVEVELAAGRAERLYRTGDLARWTADGQLQCLGRADRQVKLRGHRIEPEEIEAVLARHPAVRQAVVEVVGADRADARLAAYVVPAGEPPASAELQAFARARLPDYMVPASVTFLEAVPLTPNGKVDRRALSAPAASHARRDSYVIPRTETEARVAAAWAEVLGVEKVGAEDDFFDLGGHSLAAVRLVARLRAEHGLELPLAGLFRAPTVAGVARLIDALRAGESPADEPDVDFEAEARLDPTIVGSGPWAVGSNGSSLLPTAYGPLPTGGAPFDRVLLTGATGFLGAFLLDELLSQTTAEVVCLVRAESPAAALARVEANLRRYERPSAAALGRVVPVVGDLARPLLGLAPGEFERLAAGLDAIYHNGALVNLVYPYRRLRAANVLGTQEVLRLAARGRPTPTHFVSTFSVMAPAGRGRGLVTEDDPLPPCASLPDGYTQSKWVAEQLALRARERGLPVTVFRPGHIAGDSRSGVCNPDDLVHTLALASARAGVVPELSGSVDLTPVDYVSRAIVQLSRHPECVGGTFHLTNPAPLELPELVEWLRHHNPAVSVVPQGVWRERLREWADGPGDARLAPLLAALPGNGHGPELTPHPRYDSRRAATRLEECGVSCPPADGRLLATYWHYLRRCGAIPAAAGDALPNGT